MKILTLIVFLVISNVGLAEDDWICTEASSQRYGNEIMACGIGLGADENEARLKAFDNAKIEFERVCGSSDDCKDHTVSANPKRTTCSPQKDGKTKCYRMIQFTIGTAKQAVASPSPSNPEDISKTGPCYEIMLKCRTKGFLPYAADRGLGIIADCYEPLVRKTSQPENAKLSLPQVEPSLIEQCRARYRNKHP